MDKEKIRKCYTVYLGESYAMTWSLKYQKMYAGGSGVWDMTQVKFIVEPRLT